MGLTSTSTGAGAADTALVLRRERPDDRIVALAGNPNVGKSTVFNALTGLRQHTGNWPGKTVTSAQGRCERGGRGYVLVDLPGTYSLMAHSAEEEVARDFLCFGGADGAVVVCDATCLERNLNLVLQTLELQPRTVVCVNLLDEAERKGVRVELEGLSRRLGVPVVGAAAGRGEGLEALMAAVEGVISAPEPPTPVPVRYPPPVEFAVASLRPLLEPRLRGRLPARWTALRLLEGDGAFLDRLSAALEWDPRADDALWGAVEEARADLERQGLGGGARCERVVSALVETAEAIGAASVTQLRSAAGRREQRLDRLLTSHATGIPLMLLLLAGVLWLTITGANYPSQLLSDGLFWVQDRLSDLFAYLNAPAWLHGALVLGVYRVLAWVVSVMLPPMAIFFPLFTLLEDFGYLPRVGQGLRQAGPDHVHGLWLQCRRGGGLPDHRLPPGAAHRHSDQQLRALQRAIPPTGERANRPARPAGPPGPPAGRRRRPGRPGGFQRVSGDCCAYTSPPVPQGYAPGWKKRAARAAPAPLNGYFFLADCFRFS